MSESATRSDCDGPPAAAVRVRPARADDRALVLALVPRLHGFPLPPWRTAEQVDASESAELSRAFDRIAAGIFPDDEALMIAELGGERAGFLHAVTRLDFFDQAPAGHVSTIVVAPAAEGRGVGRALLDAAEAWARGRGYSTLGLSVFESNVRARAAYARAGFGVETLYCRKRLAPPPDPSRGP